MAGIMTICGLAALRQDDACLKAGEHSQPLDDAATSAPGLKRSCGAHVDTKKRLPL